MRNLQLRLQVSEFNPNGGEAVHFFKGNLEAPDFSRVRIHNLNDVKIWIILNQSGRCNLLSAVRIKLAMVAEPPIAAKAKERMEEGKNQYSPNDICRQGSNEQQLKPKTPSSRIKETVHFRTSQLAVSSYCFGRRALGFQSI